MAERPEDRIGMALVDEDPAFPTVATSTANSTPTAPPR